MKKKMAAIIASFALCLMMGTNALAAPSPAPPKATAVINGSKIELDIETKNATMGANEAEIKAYDAFFKPWDDAVARGELDEIWEQASSDEECDQKWGELFAKYLNESLKEFGVSCEKVNWSGEANIFLPAGIEMPAGGIDVTIEDSSISAKDQIIMLHIRSDGIIERIPNLKVADGSVTGHFNSLSPVLYFSVEGLKTTDQPASAPAGSPKTGEYDITAVIFAGAALVGILGVVGCKKKVFF